MWLVFNKDYFFWLLKTFIYFLPSFQEGGSFSAIITYTRVTIYYFASVDRCKGQARNNCCIQCNLRKKKKIYHLLLFVSLLWSLNITFCKIWRPFLNFYYYYFFIMLVGISHTFLNQDKNYELKFYNQCKTVTTTNRK